MQFWSVVRWVRAASFSAACALLAAAGHVFGGGRVDGAALALGLAIVFVPALALTGRERTMETILPAVAVTQVLLHALLPEGDGQDAVAGSVGHGQHGSSGLDMLLMHLVAILATAWWLKCGEAALCALARHLVGWVLAALLWLDCCTPVNGPRPPIGRAHRRLDLRLEVLRHVVDRRGPPLRSRPRTLCCGW
ncbi:MFS transporter [Actinomadura rudentiformis]|uniref:MFS transporter n=1 Tax=Actinomadura rudentiformis TaxID=359158 RepID=A0A6H9ZA71_9ACTN|nr:MFS transporter [Actinomadura rudentiformis]KAB2352363.1 MFS transporter [Actinomadura rudentiformis]